MFNQNNDAFFKCTSMNKWIEVAPKTLFRFYYTMKSLFQNNVSMVIVLFIHGNFQ